MAERTRLLIPAGERYTHTLRCQPPEPSEEGGSGVRGGGRLGKLDWSAVVLDEREVVLEVKFLLLPKEENGETTSERLQQKANGGNFWGTFAPAEHPKMRQEMPEKLDRLEAVVFEFDNSYSWWTPKEVELICVREAEPVSRPPAPLPPAPQPDTPTQRHPGSGTEGLGGETPAGDASGPQTQFMAIFTPPDTPREGALAEDRLRAPDLRASRRPLDASPTATAGGDTPALGAAVDVKACKLLAQLDAWLAAAEVICPTRREGVEVLVSSISELRGLCKQKLPEALPG